MLDLGLSIARPFLQAALAASFGSEAAAKPVFDPRDPFGSLCKGGHRFTLLGDTRHSDPALIEAVRDNLPQMARAGVKHLMLEYEPHGESMRILEKLYSTPPRITAEEVYKHSSLFASMYADTPEEIARSGMAYASLIVAAQRAGIRVHFTGDDPGGDLYAKADLKRLEKADYIAANSATHAMYERWMEDASLAETWPEAERIQMGQKLLDHGERLIAFNREEDSLHCQAAEARMSPSAEFARADRMVALAGGEKAVVVWGQAHFAKEAGDLDFFLDRILRGQALKEGIAFERTRRMDLVSDKNQEAGALSEEQLPDARYFVADNAAALTDRGRSVMRDKPEGAEAGLAPAPVGPSPVR